MVLQRYAKVVAFSTTRFLCPPLCLHPFHDPIRTLSNHFFASFGSQIDCSLATRTPREHLSFQASMPGLFDEDDEMDFLCSHRPAGEVHCGGSFSQVEDIMMFWLGWWSLFVRVQAKWNTHFLIPRLCLLQQSWSPYSSSELDPKSGYIQKGHLQ